MKQQVEVRRRSWRTLTEEQKRRLLADLRQRQQAQIEREARRLRER